MMKSNAMAALCAALTLGICALKPAMGMAAEDALRGTESVQPVEETAVPNRVVERIDETRLVTLYGNTHPLARTQFDRGPVDPQMPLERMILVLQRSPEQEAAAAAFMERQQDPNSPDYHHWLEPEEQGRLYGPSDADIAAVTNWLENRGFTIDEVTKGRMVILFSGTAGLVQQAFHTEIHHFTVKGEEHISNIADPSIPEALRPVVAGVMSLNDFFSKPQHIYKGSFRRNHETGKWTPEPGDVTAKPLFGVSSGGGVLPDYEMVAPYDFATIYNVLPLWNAGIDGAGITIAIAGRSTISQSDVATFRSAFGLPAKAFVLVPNGPAPPPPPTTSPDDVLENSLDVEWSGAVAKGATIKFVTTASVSGVSDGAYESALYIVDNHVAPIMSFSYGLCELFAGSSGNTAYNQLWQEGAMANISEFVASGDQGSAACDGGQSAPYGAEDGLAVSGSSSTPYNVAVGGTDFKWANLTGTYWSSTNSSTNKSSALGYIPEVPWNSSCASDDILDLYEFTSHGFNEEAACNYMDVNDFDVDFVNVAGGTGGKSDCTAPTGTTPATCAGGYAKPTWQTGTGVPADGKRDVPDLSLFASDGPLFSMYVVCDSKSGPCSYGVADDALAQGVGGTSVASPAMAGIMALVLQKVGGTPQGLPNKEFYTLAGKDSLTTCNSINVKSGNSCNFYDITSDNIKVPCVKGDRNCVTSVSTDSLGIISSYVATAGFDLATGLGSVNAANLVDNWPGATPTASVTLTPATLSFPNTATGTTSEAQAVTVTNTGTAAVTLKSITVTGTDPTSFVEVNACGTSLAKGAKCTVFVAFKPAAAAAEKATLSVAETTGTPQTASLSGTGTAKPSVSLSKTGLTFAATAKGTLSEAQSITVTNKGTDTLDITAISITGADASSFIELNTCGPTLAPAANCVIDVAFKPAATGTLSASLVIADNGSTATQTVTLKGTGN
jgi:hypothetical protein